MSTAESTRLLRPREVWERLTISKATFWRLVEAGQIPTLRVGKQVRVDPRELEQWLYGEEQA